MKNLTEINTKQKCYRCEKIGFYVETPHYGDNVTCPCCDSEKEKEEEENEDNNIMHQYIYCDSCRIVYNIGCNHAENLCPDNTMNAHVISKWKYKGEIYVGMPQFDSHDEYMSEINKIEVLETVCLRNEGPCVYACYKEEMCPSSYGCHLPLNKNFVSSDESLKYCFE